MVRPDFIFGLAGNAVLARQDEGLMTNARGHLALHQSLAAQGLGPEVAAVRLFGEFEYAARSWPQAFRVLVKAEVPPSTGGLPAKDNERFVVTTLRSASRRTLYQQDYCARGQAENLIKQVKCDLKSDRTSVSTFFATPADNRFSFLLCAGEGRCRRKNKKPARRRHVDYADDLCNIQDKYVLEIKGEMLYISAL